MSEEGIVYVLSNEAMPGLVKIGRTNRADLEVRLKELYTTGVPLPFKCEYACKVADYKSVEDALHQAFSTDRVNPQREFFKVSLDRIIPILELLKIEDITSAVEAELNQNVTQSELNAIETYQKRRPSLNFEEMGIPIGSELVMNYKGQQYKCTVKTQRTVEYENNEIALSLLTAKLRESSNKYVQPCPFWFFNGVCLSDIYENTYASE